MRGRIKGIGMLKGMKGAGKLVWHLHKVKKILSRCPQEVARAGIYKRILEEAKCGSPIELAKLTREKLLPLYCPTCQAAFKKIYAQMAKDFPGLV